MAESKEQLWGCGCHEVDGELVKQCTQTKPASALSAAEHHVAAPYSQLCFRARAQEPVIVGPPDRLETAKEILSATEEGDSDGVQS